MHDTHVGEPAHEETKDQASQASDPQMADPSAEPGMVEKVLERFREEGYRPVIDDDGDIRFKREGKYVYLRGATLDECYYRLAMGFSTNIELPVGYAAACEITSGYRLLKTHVSESMLLLTIEAYYATPEAFFEHLETFLGTLVAGKSDFEKVYREHLEKAREAKQVNVTGTDSEGVLENVDESSLLA